jgi:hypothetical protein
VLSWLVDHFADQVGRHRRRELGTLDRRSLLRYAVACGETDAPYVDVAAARELGYPDLLALPNYLAAMSDDAADAADSDLNVDGTSALGRFGALPPEVTVLGGSETLRFLAPVHAGMSVEHGIHVVGVTSRQGSDGRELCLVTFEDEFSVVGELVLLARRTVVLR